MTLAEILRGIKDTPASYLNAAKLIEKGAFEELRSINVAFLSTFTAEFVRPYLVAESAPRGILAKPQFGPFNQIEQQVFDPDSPLYRFRPLSS